MSTIQFKEAKCKNCYKCIRSCPVKAISFKNDQARIMEDNCILCGRCLRVCPQNAKNVEEELEYVKDMIRSGERVYASLAPSFIASFGTDGASGMFSALKKLGFAYVEETAVGAAMVSREYQRLAGMKDRKNIITSACAAVVSLVEKYYPDLIGQLAPVVSPMIAHGRALRKRFGQDIKVVFIGPCLAKKEEYKDLQNDSVIDAVITFEELQRWLSEEGVSVEEGRGQKDSGFEGCISRFYPVPGGILKTIDAERSNFECVSIDGIENCIEVLDSLRVGSVEGYFIEMNSCPGGCVNGPCTALTEGGYLLARARIKKYVSSSTGTNPSRIPDIGDDIKKTFVDRSTDYRIPDENTIAEILRKIGKFTKEDELNCGACGYASCRDKAIAVYNSKAELHMCLPYMREKAESISNVVISSTPNAIIVLNHDLVIQEANIAAVKILNVRDGGLIGMNIYDVLCCPDFEKVRDTGKDIINSKYCYEKNSLVVEQSVLYIRKRDTIIIVMKDITNEERDKEQLYRVRCETVDLAQKVIDKQMTVAQEIASLLGETTAQTKVALTKLKKTITSEMGEGE